MNSLESRIHDAAASAAAEVRPCDIPPLRPPAGRRGPLWRRGTAGGRAGGGGTRAPHRGRRWLTPLAAAASVAALVGCLVLLRHMSRADQGGGEPWSSSVSRAQMRLAAEALDAYFPATGAQYTAGLAFEWTRQKILARDTGPCLAQAGFPQPPFSVPKRQFILSAPNNRQFPDLTQRMRTHIMTPAGGSASRHQADVVPGPRRRAYAAAMQACVLVYARPLWRLDQAATPLAGKWLKTIRRIQASALVRTMRPGFVGCLEAFGIPARYANSSGPASQPLFAGFFAWMARLGQASTSPARFARQQRLWTPVFVTCARPTVTVVERIQVAARSKFLAVHAGQIGAIQHIAIGLLPLPG